MITWTLFVLMQTGSHGVYPAATISGFDTFTSCAAAGAELKSWNSYSIDQYRCVKVIGPKP